MSEKRELIEGATEVAAPSRFPSVVDILAFLGIFFVGEALGLSAAWMAGLEMNTGEFNAVQYGVAMSATLAGVLYYRVRRHAPKAPMGLTLKCFNPPIVVWGVALMLALAVVIEPLLELMPDVPNEAYGRGVWTLLTVVVMAPIFEELLFRGVLLESLRLRYGVVTAWVLSSFLFGLVHLHPTIAVNAMIMGLVLGFIYIATRSLWASVALHAANNAISFLMLSTGNGDLTLSEAVANRALYWVLYSFSAVLLCVSVYYLLRLLGRQREEEKNSAAE